jgi:hypothetical protein
MFVKQSSNTIEVIKWIAILTMVIDHAGIILFGDNDVMRFIGRAAFPLFGYLLIHNYLYFTSNKLNYIKRLWIFALISQPFYMLAISQEKLNVFVLLALTLTSLYGLERATRDNRLQNAGKVAVGGSVIVFFSILSFVAEYSLPGYLFLLLLYLAFTNNRYMMLPIAGIVWMNLGRIDYQIGAMISVVDVWIAMHYPIQLPRTSRWFFYAFYPMHLGLLYVVSLFGLS